MHNAMSPVSPRKIVFVDAFAGCGGLSLGLIQAGCTGLFAIEKDRFAFTTLKANLLEPTSRYQFEWPAWLPQKNVSIATFLKRYASHLSALAGKIDILVGGPPCQGFSSAGKRRCNDPRNKLFIAYVQLVEALQPRIVLMENVRGFTVDFDSGSRVHNYAETLRQLLSKDYDVHEELIDLTQLGVPQGRTRYFLIAVKRGLSFGNPFDRLRSRLPTFLRTMGLTVPVASWSAISDLEISRRGRRPSVDTDGFEEIAYAGPRTKFQRLLNDGTKQPSDLRLARHTDEVVRRFKKIIELSHADGRLNTSISEDIRERFGLKKKALRVLDPDRPSPTVTSMPDDLLHYSEPRTLTVRENARLQTFPDWFVFKGKYTTGGHLRRKEVPRFTQVANAVPPLVAQAFGELLIELLQAEARQKRAA